LLAATSLAGYAPSALTRPTRWRSAKPAPPMPRACAAPMTADQPAAGCDDAGEGEGAVL